MVALSFESLKGLKFILDQKRDQYPFYCLLLYTPDNGLNARLHKYVKSHWNVLDGLTGPNCLLLAIEDVELKIPIDKFKPEDVYNIARYMGASVDTVPGMIFFTEPRTSRDTQILKLNEFLSNPGNLTDEELTDFFVSVQSIVDGCCKPTKRRMTRVRQILGLKTANQNLECLRKGLDKEWPLQSRWADVANKVPNLVVTSIATTATIALAIDKIYSVLLHLLG